MRLDLDLWVLLIFLGIIAWHDFKRNIIPDELLLSAAAFHLVYLIFSNSFINILYSIGNLLLILVPFLLLTVMWEKKTGKFAMGGGDIKLAGLLSFCLGSLNTVIILFGASLIQVAAMKFMRMKILPLAPAVFVSTIIMLFFK